MKNKRNGADALMMTEIKNTIKRSLLVRMLLLCAAGVMLNIT